MLLALVIPANLFAQQPFVESHPIFPHHYDYLNELSSGKRAFRYHFLKDLNYVLNVNQPGFLSTKIKNVRTKTDEKFYVLPQLSYHWSPGPPDYTGNPLDCMIESPGNSFFTVDFGKTLGYTQDGRFRIDYQNRLVHISGHYPIVGVDGPIFVPEEDAINFTRSGAVFAYGQEMGKLAIATFKSFEEMDEYLVKVNNSFFVLDAPIEQLNDESAYAVRQGYITQSNSKRTKTSFLFKNFHRATSSALMSTLDNLKKHHALLAPR